VGSKRGVAAGKSGQELMEKRLGGRSKDPEVIDVSALEVFEDLGIRIGCDVKFTRGSLTGVQLAAP
jgi:hypothetical protein